MKHLMKERCSAQVYLAAGLRAMAVFASFLDRLAPSMGFPQVLVILSLVQSKIEGNTAIS